MKCWFNENHNLQILQFLIIMKLTLNSNNSELVIGDYSNFISL